MKKTKTTSVASDHTAPIEWPPCPDHSWCWGSCQLPNQPASEPLEHRTYYRVFEPADELIEHRSSRRRSIATGMAMRSGDRAPLIHVGIQTGGRQLAVRLTFEELTQLSADLWAAGADLAREMSKNDRRVQCSDCGTVFHPSALGGRDCCRDCDGTLYWVAAAEGDPDGSEPHGNKINQYGRGVPRVECRDCECSFHPDSSPHPDRCGSCAERVDGVTV